MSATQDDIWGVFSVYGPISYVTIGASTHLCPISSQPFPRTNTFPKAKDTQGKPAGYAYVKFRSKEDAIRAKEGHMEFPIRMGPRRIRIEYGTSTGERDGPPLPSPRRRAVKDRTEPSPTVFVGDVPYGATGDDIRKALEPLGSVKAIRIRALL